MRRVCPTAIVCSSVLTDTARLHYFLHLTPSTLYFQAILHKLYKQQYCMTARVSVQQQLQLQHVSYLQLHYCERCAQSQVCMNMEPRGKQYDALDLSIRRGSSSSSSSSSSVEL
jgi:hypothetical protein